jgi:hypothetical protein
VDKICLGTPATEAACEFFSAMLHLLKMEEQTSQFVKTILVNLVLLISSGNINKHLYPHRGTPNFLSCFFL